MQLPGGLGTAELDSLACPVAKGDDAAASFSMTVPAMAPAGQYDVRLEAKDQAGGIAYCVDVAFSLKE